MNLEPRLLADGITVCCEGQYLCNECKTHYAAQGVPRTAQAKLRAVTRWVPKALASGTPPKIAHGAPTKEIPYIEQPPPDGYAMALQRGGQRPTYTSDDPLDGYAAAIAKRQKENR